jgi:hypothetical protein
VLKLLAYCVYTNYKRDLSWYRTVLNVLELHSILEWNQTEIDCVNPLKKQGRCHMTWKLHELIDEWIKFGARIISVPRRTAGMIWWWCSFENHRIDRRSEISTELRAPRRCRARNSISDQTWRSSVATVRSTRGVGYDVTCIEASQRES